MRYVKLKKTDLSVSPICLGTVNYGTALSEADSKKQMSRFLDEGGNFIDTAQVYGAWGTAPEQFSEYVIGNWFEENKCRDKVVLATKGVHPKWEEMGKPRVNRKCIEEDLAASLRLLKTDYIDMYFLHRDDPNAPVAEIMECLDDMRKAGKIRHYGCSNWKLSRIKEAQAYCEENGLEGFVCNQLMWSLADINFYALPDKTFVLIDKETIDYCAKTDMNVMAYMSIAKGYFALRAAREKLPSGVADVYNNTSNDKIYEYAKSIVGEGRYSFMDLAFMYIMAEADFPAIPIASFDDMKQLNECIDCIGKPIPADAIKKLANLKKFTYWE